MQHFQDLTFELLFDQDSGAVFANYVFERCVFDNCHLCQTINPKLRSKVSNVAFVDCTSLGSDIGPAVLESVTVDRLKIGGILILWGSVFKHVTLKGKIGGELKINAIPSIVHRGSEVKQPFDTARDDFYKNVDWALDISEAEFNQFDMAGIPVNLVRRDPKTQVIITYQKFVQETWRKIIAPWNDYWLEIVDISMGHAQNDIILVAPKGRSKKKVQQLVDGLKDLQDIGLAEPN